MNKIIQTKSLPKIDESQANDAMALKTWWAIPFIQPFSRKLVVFIVNNTGVSANQITFTSIVFRLITISCFFSTSRSVLAIGAISYFFAYVCDCADGAVARIKKQTTELGRYLDHIADLMGDIFILTALSYSHGLFGSFMYSGMIFMHISECYMSYLAGFAIRENFDAASSPEIFNFFNRYRQWWFSRNIKSFFSFPDYTAFVFVFSVLFGIPKAGLQIGFWFLLVICLYSIFSTFVSVHSHIKHFP